MNREQLKTDGGELRKIMLLGLDNAGKTSIVLTLKGDKSLLSYMSLSPTMNHNITNITVSDTKFNIWDFGGQETYRKEHLENMEDYIEGCNKIIYVIDVQDYERYDISLTYLKDLLVLIDNSYDKIQFSVFLHKYDPNIKEIKPKISDKIDELLSKVKEIVPSDIDLKIFKTTIYTTFEKTPIFL
ncbi:MAG: ADP-ribosylation factor-like protein [Promethearchaeati archaeon]